MKTLVTLVLLAMVVSVIGGCKASAEVGDTATSVMPAR
jgi:hypothetical protein